MKFSFPKNFTVKYGMIMKYNVNGKYDYIDISNPAENSITINSIDYFFTPLSDSGNKGGNSIILKIYEAQEFNLEDIEYGIPDCILKINKNPLRTRKTKLNKRFEREIEALKKCKTKKIQNVINIEHSGVCNIDNNEYQFYTMEYAECDLKTYIEIKHKDIKLIEKINLCISLSEGLSELNKLGYYHRDIKPDNIFIIGGDKWKIGDLGLLEDRKSETLDGVAEFIGPRGWITPEAMNKYLCEAYGYTFKHNCSIDHKSDIFQLGKVFWYIFQHNAPIGNIKESDFLIKENGIFPIIKTMLNYSKKSRYNNIDEITKLLKKIELRVLKSNNE